MEAGNQLSPEQHNTLSKLDEVELQIEFVKEMQKLNKKQLKLYSRAVRKREFEEVTIQLLYYKHIISRKHIYSKISNYVTIECEKL